MKILFISHRFYPDIGGIEVNSEILAQAFHRAGHIVRLITWSAGEGEKRFPFLVKRNPGFAELIKEHGWADVVYENNVCLRLAWPSLLFHKPSVVAVRAVVSRPDGRIEWQDKLKYNWLRRARSVIAVSDFIRRKCWPPATVIGNPYRADIFKMDPDSRRNNHFVFLGRLVSDKGADLAIRAVHLMSMVRDFPNPTNGDGWLLTIVGDGPFKSHLQTLTNLLGLNNRVRFAGALTGKPLVDCLNDHRYILVPSLCEEAFGNVALEGMACGCIPIVSDAGGLPDAVGNAGLVFPKGNISALTKCMLRLSIDTSLQGTLREAASAHLDAHHPDRIANRYLEVIETANHKN